MQNFNESEGIVIEFYGILRNSQEVEEIFKNSKEF